MVVQRTLLTDLRNKTKITTGLILSKYKCILFKIVSAFCISMSSPESICLSVSTLLTGIGLPDISGLSLLLIHFSNQLYNYSIKAVSYTHLDVYKRQI